MENIKKIRFEDTDKELKIDIYGEVFKINESKLEELDIENLEKEDDEKSLEDMLEGIIGVGAVEKINKIRKEAGYEKLGAGHILAIFMSIIEIYTDKVLDPINKVEKKYDYYDNKMNRFERRNQKYKRNNYYRR